MNSKYIIISLFAVFCMTVSSYAQIKEDTGIDLSNIVLDSDEKTLKIDMEVSIDRKNVKPTQVLVLTPYLINGTDSLMLKSIGVYGRNRYFFYQRNADNSPTDTSDMIFRKSSTPEAIYYQTEVEFMDWMDGCRLSVTRTDFGCCGEETFIGNEDIVQDFTLNRLTPELIYVQPEAEFVKQRQLSGSAFIDFPVNVMEINPDYRSNSSELKKITATIDSVRNDKDITIKSISIKGFASPESSYSNNTRLAKGRTEALKEYVENIYHFGYGFIMTDFEPEDWEGLRKYVENSNLPNRNDIISTIEKDIDPDRKEWIIKSTWIDDYNYLLHNCYPALRHSDYMIEYTIRSFGDPKEIEKIYHTAPQKLSLKEFFILGNTYEKGSEAFLQLFETAVRFYPEDDVANLNAANAAILIGDYDRALNYLDNAGNLPEAMYTRGALEIYRQNYADAETYLKLAQELGVEKATTALEQIRSRRTIYRKTNN